MSDTFDRRSKKLRTAVRKACADAACWEEVHNSVFGVGALFSQLFSDIKDREAFSRSEIGAEVRAMIESLPGRTIKSGTFNGRILLRIPGSLHAALVREAEHEGVSLNHLIAVKLAATLQDVVSAKQQ